MRLRPSSWKPELPDLGIPNRFKLASSRFRVPLHRYRTLASRPLLMKVKPTGSAKSSILSCWLARPSICSLLILSKQNSVARRWCCLPGSNRCENARAPATFGLGRGFDRARARRAMPELAETGPPSKRFAAAEGDRKRKLVFKSPQFSRRPL